MQEAAITFDDVHYGFGAEPVVDGISFTVQKGDFFVLLGPNGGGKTTLIKLALGLFQPQAGRVELFGIDARRYQAWERVGYVPQKATGFDAHFPGTVAEVVAQGEYSGLDALAFLRRSVSVLVEEALKVVGMWPYREERIGSLSRGQQQRVLIARALVRPRQLLVLDEPTAGVDRAGQQSFYALLRELHQERGITVFLVSHDVGVVLRAATRVACISRTLIFHGLPTELTEGDISRLYGVPVELLIHQHE